MGSSAPHTCRVADRYPVSPKGLDPILAELTCIQNEEMPWLNTSIRVSWQIDEGSFQNFPQIDRSEHEESLGVTPNTPVASL